MSQPQRGRMERAFTRIRGELEIRTEFPPEVLRAAAAAAESTAWRQEERVDLEPLPWVTIDPPGSRDLDQALCIEREGDRLRVHYAIADVACFVERGGVVEEEAWRRALTFYSPDRRDPLYPESISQGAASLLANEPRPAIVFTLELDAAGLLAGYTVRRARVRSRAQLTYAQALEHIQGGGERYAGEPFAQSLLLLREVGERRLAVERERGGVSLPIPEQHVQRRAALRLGYQLQYEDPNPAEEWNAQVSLLTGHAAAERMLAAGVGVVRVMPPPDPADIARLRTAARTLGFQWPEEQRYPEFMHSLVPTHPHLPILVWQARYLMRGADYVAFDGERPPHPDHAALAMTYAHCTAPLRRLADRYVLDLLVQLERGQSPSPAETATLRRLPEVMNAADRRQSRLERGVVDAAEAWELRDRVGDRLHAVVLDAQPRRVEVQVEDPPVRARIPLAEGSEPPALGATVEVRVAEVELEEGRVVFRLER